VTARLVFPVAAIIALAIGSLPALAAQPGKSRPPVRAAATDLPSSIPSRAAADIINWVIETGDNGNRPFMVIDKVAAQLFIFHSSGRVFLEAPVLIGIAKGDASAPGVGNRELSKIPVAQRTTPAGRFLAYFGRAVGYKEDVLWVDYATAISLHAVVTSNPAEHRLARLQSPTSKDNRITFGCINVNAAFYKKIIAPLFRRGGMVYILPEQRPLSAVFAGFPADDPQPSLAFENVFDADELPTAPISMNSHGD
jgi:hypothetical protein